jgi:hypothetical protein
LVLVSVRSLEIKLDQQEAALRLVQLLEQLPVAYLAIQMTRKQIEVLPKKNGYAAKKKNLQDSAVSLKS